jgi:hypothetical protein
MPLVTFLAWDERVNERRIRKQNEARRAEWRRRIEEMKRRGG